jgi:hypothetical protein
MIVSKKFRICLRTHLGVLDLCDLLIRLLVARFNVYTSIIYFSPHVHTSYEIYE